MSTITVAGPQSLVLEVVEACLAQDPPFPISSYCETAELLLAGAQAGTVAVICLFGAHDELEAAVPELLKRGARVVVVTHGVGVDHLQRLLLAGASSVLPFTRISPSDLVDAVVQVAAGGASLHPVVAAAVLEQWRELRAGAPAVHSNVELTAREREVLDGLVAGLATKQIARQLEVAAKTVESHQARLFQKLGVRNRAQAVSVALERGLTSRP